MKKLISTLTLAILMLSMTTFALAAPAAKNSSCTGFSVVTGSGCTQSDSGSSTGSSTYSIYDYLKSLGISCGNDAAQSSTPNSRCSASKDASCTSGSGKTYVSPNGNEAANTTETETTASPQKASDTPTSASAAPATASPESISPETTTKDTVASTDNTADKVADTSRTSSPTCSGNTCASNSTCISGTCASNSAGSGSSCSSSSTCSGGSCVSDSAGSGSSCNIGTTYGAKSPSSYGSTLSELLASLHQQCSGAVSRLSEVLKNCIGRQPVATPSQNEATPAPTSSTGTTTPDAGTTPSPVATPDSGTTPNPAATPDSGTTPSPAATPDSGTTPTDNTGSGTTPSGNVDNLSFEQQVAQLVNEQRSANGLQPLTLSADLSDMARAKSQDMHDNNYFSHTSPTYGSPFDMMKTFGISYRTAGENIAMGYATPEEVVNAWMNSAGHRANILNSSYTQIGVGYVADGNYWTQEFIG